MKVYTFEKWERAPPSSKSKKHFLTIESKGKE